LSGIPPRYPSISSTEKLKESNDIGTDGFTTLPSALHRGFNHCPEMIEVADA
jgi:hypothetical protein